MDSYKIINASQFDNDLEIISDEIRRIRSVTSTSEKYSFPEDIKEKMQEIEVNKQDNINFSLSGTDMTGFKLNTVIASPTIFENYNRNNSINFTSSFGNSIGITTKLEGFASEIVYEVPGLTKKVITEQMSLNAATGIVSITVPAGDCYVSGSEQTKIYTIDKLKNNDISFDFNDTTGKIIASISKSGFITSSGISNEYTGLTIVNDLTTFSVSETGLISVKLNSGFIPKGGISKQKQLTLLEKLPDMEKVNDKYTLTIPGQKFIPNKLTFEIQGQTEESVYTTEEEEGIILLHIPAGYYPKDYEINLNDIIITDSEKTI